MATPLSDLVALLKINLQVHSAKDSDLVNPFAFLSTKKSVLMEFGTGLDKANLLWADRRILAASGSENLNLGSGLSNSFGDSLEFTNVKAIVVFNITDETWGDHTATTAVITIGGAASTPFSGPFANSSDKISIPTSGMFVVTNPTLAGWDVYYPTSEMLLLVENEDASNEALYDIILIGESG